MSGSSTKNQGIYDRPAELLQDLIHFDTTNPPGNEKECINYIDNLLAQSGIETSILAKEPDRPNLIARLKGSGNAPPLMLYGHVDVVTTDNQEWSHPPFEGKEADGYIWGRGALDMKAGVAMMLAAFLRAKATGMKPAGDIVFAALSDEEGGGTYGAKYLVEEHAELFSDIRYAIGEFGGFSTYISGRKFYPIQVAEKQICWLRAIIRGPGGHGAKPMRGGAMAKLAKLLLQLDQHRLPVHVTPIVRQMIGTMAESLPFISGLVLRQLLRPSFTDKVLKMLGVKGQNFEPLLYNTVNSTIVHGGEAINVIPSEIVLDMDGRLLPGCTPDDFISELREIIGNEVQLEVMRHDPCSVDPDMGMFNILSDILRDADPGSEILPLLLPAVSDARFFSRLNIQTYGFTPMKLNEEFNFFETIHAANERIPLEAIDFGTNAIYELLQRYAG